MIIEKKQADAKRYSFNWSYFNLAREGLKRILQTDELSDKKILVPAYIGYSTKEGSGVFDPIRDTKTEYLFYSLDSHLNINFEKLKRKINENRSNILLLIHYFGFRDKNLALIKEFARKHDMIIIEDFAHAFFSFWSNPVIDFDYGIFSIHKLFPIDSGGMVIAGKGRELKNEDENGPLKYDLFNYNIKGIIQKRTENYEYILRNLKSEAALYKITILKEELHGAVPQTFPILLHDKELRDCLYFRMNKEGYGIISLYHTLIDEIDSSFTVEHEISNRVLNLPVHQDIRKEDLDHMIERMLAIIKGYSLIHKDIKSQFSKGETEEWHKVRSQK